jgi:hypothetical protein
MKIKQYLKFSLTVDQFNQFFADKNDAVRAITAKAPDPTFSPAPTGDSPTEFQSVIMEDIVTAISKLPDKSSAADSLQVSVIPAPTPALGQTFCLRTALKHIGNQRLMTSFPHYWNS